MKLGVFWLHLNLFLALDGFHVQQQVWDATQNASVF